MISKLSRKNRILIHPWKNLKSVLRKRKRIRRYLFYLLYAGALYRIGEAPVSVYCSSEESSSGVLLTVGHPQATTTTTTTIIITAASASASASADLALKTAALRFFFSFFDCLLPDGHWTPTDSAQRGQQPLSLSLSRTGLCGATKAASAQRRAIRAANYPPPPPPPLQPPQPPPSVFMRVSKVIVTTGSPWSTTSAVLRVSPDVDVIFDYSEMSSSKGPSSQTKHSSALLSQFQ